MHTDRVGVVFLLGLCVAAAAHAQGSGESIAVFSERLSDHSRVELIDLVAVPTDQPDTELSDSLARITHSYTDRRGAASR